MPAGANAATAAEPRHAADVGDLERALRHELATAADPTAAALELADLLCALERHREALAAVEAALRRADHPGLQVGRAGLLRDLARRREAAEVLTGLATAHGPGALHPALLFECAELHWLAGDAAAAKATLDSLQQAHADDEWCAANRPVLEGLAAELGNAAGPPRVRVRDLLASLRGAGTASERVRLLGELCELADAESGARRQHLRSRAIAIGCADESPAVRARAVQLAEPPPADALDFCTAALADDAALVRRCAADRAVADLGARAVPVLVDALARETDAMAFGAIHQALAELVVDGPSLEGGSAVDDAERSRVAAAWRQRCSR
ncbi:MAG: hypothetical protein KF830_13195 [Planctomycetes bacterium]|nr:hypothetical protein [Planctomycetota bacterium]